MRKQLRYSWGQRILSLILCLQLAWVPSWPTPASADVGSINPPAHSDPYSQFNPLIDGAETGPEASLLKLEERFSETQLDELLHQFSEAIAAQGERPFVFDRFHLLAQTVNRKYRERGGAGEGEPVLEPVWRYVTQNRMQVEFHQESSDQRFFEVDIPILKKVNLNQLSAEVVSCEGGCFFRFALGNGEVLHDFRIPAEWMTRVGNLLIWQSRWYRDRLSIINLETFAHNFGNSDIPVFDVPFPFLERTHGQAVARRGKELVFAEEYRISLAQLEDVSRIYESLYFMTANYLEPARLTEFHYLSRSLMEYVESQASPSQLGQGTTKGFDERAIAADVRGILARQNQALKAADPQESRAHEVLEQAGKWGEAHGEAFRQALRQQDVVGKSLQSSLESYERGQKFSGKLKKLLAVLIAPNARAADLIEGATVGMMAKLKQIKGGETASAVLHWLSQHPTLSVASVAMAGVTLSAPDSVAIMFKQALDSLEFAYQPVWDMLKGTSLAVWQSTVDTSAILLDTREALSQQYVDNGNWWRLMVGLTALSGALVVVIGGYHTLATMTRLARDRISGKMAGIVQRQEHIFAQYYDMLARSEEARRGQAQEAGGGARAKESAEIRKKIQQIEAEEAVEKEKRSQLWHRKSGRWLLSPVRLGVSAMGKAAHYSAGLLGLRDEKYEDNRYVKSKWQAISSLIFSYASYTRSVLDLVKFWNGFSRFRYSLASWGFIEVYGLRVPAYVKPHPQILVYQLAYPYFFREAVVKGEGQAVPSVLNGGTTPLWQVAMRWLARYGGSLSPDEMKQYYQAVEEFEEHIVKVEKVIVPEITLAAVEALGGFVKDDRDLRLLYSAKSVARISEAVLNRLSAESQRFVRVYYELLYSKIMRRLLQEKLQMLPVDGVMQTLVGSGGKGTASWVDLASTDPRAGDEPWEIEEAELERMSLQEFKDLFSRYKVVNGQLPDFNVEQEKVRSWIRAEIRQGAVLAETQSTIANDRRLLGEVKRKYATLSVLDPQQNGSFKRYATVQKNSRDPVALARAIKFEISQMLVTLPVKIGVKLLASAGIYEGLYKPIQESMFGENSIFYLSQMSFYNGVLFGVFLNLLANSWYKIQENAFHDENGELGIVPRKEDAKKSYFRWFMKMSFGKKNSLVLNYQRYATLVFWNIPAAMILYGVFQPFFLGRIDIEAIMAGYAVGYLTPAEAFRMKMEQGFERSAYYDGRHFTDEELASSEVQRFMESRIQKRRNRFNLITDFFMDWVDNWATNIFFVPREGVGPRAFFREVFAGWLPTEILVDRMRFVSYQVADIPVLNSLASGVAAKCELLFTRGNPDLIKIK